MFSVKIQIISFTQTAQEINEILTTMYGSQQSENIYRLAGIEKVKIKLADNSNIEYNILTSMVLIFCQSPVQNAWVRGRNVQRIRMSWYKTIDSCF